MKRFGIFPTALVFLFFLNGCASVLPKQALESVTPGISYAQVKQNPDPFKGDTLLLGGMILANQISRQGSTLEVLRYTTDRSGEPLGPDEKSGRFLARTDRFLDPELYQAGRLITLTGTVLGRETRPLGKTVYVYPLFRIGALYLWPRYRYVPAPYPYYYMYGPYPFWGPPYGWPYGPWYGPYWYGPYW